MTEPVQLTIALLNHGQWDALRHFGDAWELVSVPPYTGPPLPGPLRNAQPTWYRLRKH